MRGFVVYTVLRLGLLLATWFLIQLLTPLRGLFAVAVAFVVSGVIGFFLLDRPRNEASVSLSRVFKRIDDRIERAKTAEDDYVDAVAAQRAELATEGEAEAEQEAKGQDEQPGELENSDEVAPASSIDNQEPGPSRNG